MVNVVRKHIRSEGMESDIYNRAVLKRIEEQHEARQYNLAILEDLRNRITSLLGEVYTENTGESCSHCMDNENLGENGSHYKTVGQADTILMFERLYCRDSKEPLVWAYIFNIMKYQQRLGIKDDTYRGIAEDMSKIKDYKDRLNKLLEEEPNLNDVIKVHLHSDVMLDA